MSESPIYLQISAFIEDQIVDKKLKVDEQVPSTNALSKVLKINPATAGKGLNVLVERHILYKKRGIGMFVTEEARHIIIEKRRETFMEDELPRLIREAKRLNISSEDLEQMIRSEYNA